MNWKWLANVELKPKMLWKRSFSFPHEKSVSHYTGIDNDLRRQLKYSKFDSPKECSQFPCSRVFVPQRNMALTRRWKGRTNDFRIASGKDWTYPVERLTQTRRIRNLSVELHIFRNWARHNAVWNWPPIQVDSIIQM